MNNKRRLNMRQNRKWTEEEIATVVDYLLENRDLEQPTAQIYYRKFLDKSKLNVPWGLVKWKVRHLRVSFRKAKKMNQLIEAGILRETEKEKLRKLWPHFDKLRELFDDEEYDVDDSENSAFYPAIYTITTFDDSNEEQIPKIEHEEFLNYNSPTTLVTLREPVPPHAAELANGLHETFNQSLLSPLCPLREPDQPQSTNSPNEFRENSLRHSTDSAKVTSSAKKRKSSEPKNLIAAFTRSQEERNANQRLLLKFEKQKFYKEFEFNKEKFKIEQELKREEIELRKRQIEREEKFKILEMEYKERIAKYELDLKYERR